MATSSARDKKILGKLIIVTKSYIGSSVGSDPGQVQGISGSTSLGKYVNHVCLEGSGYKSNATDLVCSF